MGYICYRPDGVISSKALYNAYRSWCDENMLSAVSAQTFSTELNRTTHLYGIRRTEHVVLPGCKRCRGYVGVCLWDSREQFEVATEITDEDALGLPW